MTEGYLAKEAARLLADEVLLAAFDRVRREALEALAICQAENTTQVLRLQAKVGVIEEVLSELHAMIIRGAPKRESQSTVI